MLEAIAAAPSVDEFGHQRLGRQPDRPAEEHVEVFKRDRLRMMRMDPGERHTLGILRSIYEREFSTWDTFVRSSGLKLAE